MLLVRRRLGAGSLVTRQQRRGIIGEVLGVLANPAETVRSLAESRKLLSEAREEINEQRERAQVTAKHTFSPLPGFFARSKELAVIQRALAGVPSFTVLFGASSVGKTALLREVLSSENYHVLHFDLRIAGFADVASLYYSLGSQMQAYFERIGKFEGYEEFEKESWSYKHDRLDVQRRVEAGDSVKTSDVSRLMELFQSSLLKYWEFEPQVPDSNSSDSKTQQIPTMTDTPKPRTVGGTTPSNSRLVAQKKIPVFFLDEAHKLPALISSTTTMKCLLDAMLVLTKQDRLCHVVHATSDGFYQTWLRRLNVMQHCKVLTIGDCSKSETLSYFNNNLLPDVPSELRPGLQGEWEALWNAFGGKLAHWADFVGDYVSAGGRLTVSQSSHFLQAHALLHLQLLHASKSGTTSFNIYSPLSAPEPLSDSSNVLPTFSADQLLDVMHRLLHSPDRSLTYFPLCREIGVEVVDGLVHARILELRWTSTVTEEGDERHSSLKDNPTLGPKVMPTTPILGYAMKVVLQEYGW